jgi:3-oxoacyl-[acyl-carrier-protein] synthase II
MDGRANLRRVEQLRGSRRLKEEGGMDRERRRVVVTGIGAISPVGNTGDETWSNLRAGRSGVGPITRFDPGGFETTFAAEVKGFDPVSLLGKKESRRLDRYAQFAVVVAREAMAQSGLRIDPETAGRVGVVMATAAGGMETVEEGATTLRTSGPRRVNPFFVPLMLGNMASGAVAIDLGARGPNLATVSACASAAHAIGEATDMIRAGRADAIVAGGSEACVTPLMVAGFNAMGALSKRNDEPERASRPFDLGRDGFVIAEGAAALVLEGEDVARARGATILGEVLGYATTDDAHHMVQPSPGGVGAAEAIRLALGDAGLPAEAIDYVNAHGTSTQLNEKLETAALKASLGEHAHRVPISSTKSMTGHLLGAAGALEAAISFWTIRDGCLPPTINYGRLTPIVTWTTYRTGLAPRGCGPC